MKRAASLLAQSLAAIALLHAGTAAAKKPPAAHPTKAAAPTVLAPASTAITADILDAIASEMDRATKSLKIDGVPGPYHISYKVTEVQVNDAAASLGYTTSKKERHFVNLEARVRVGSTQLDNSNFVVAGADSIDGVAGINLPLEATPKTARRATWLVTDQAYKEALMQLRAKLDSRKTGGVGATNVPSWTMEKPIVDETTVPAQALETVAELEARAKDISATFRNFPNVRDSHVGVTSYLERRWYINTDGTNVTDTRRVSGIAIVATSQAADGQQLAQYFVRYGHSAAELPDDDAARAEAGKLSTTLAALATAPVMQRYSGPVLFEGDGAVGLIRNTLAPQLGGTPVPEGLRPQQAKQFGGGFSDKLGLRVMPATLSVFDDPTAGEASGHPIIGGYRIDDEGVASQRVEVVKDGMLKSLLTSRTPAEAGAVSNGHARRLADGGTFHGSATNLIVTAKGGVSRAQLEKKLIAAAKSEGLSSGLIVRQFDDASITAEPEFTRRELIQLLSSSDLDLPPPTMLAYRLYPNGKEELVRDAQLREVPLRAWKDVLAVGNTQTVFNFLSSGESYIANVIGGGTDEGYAPSSGVESSVATPDLLFKEIDVVSNTAGQRSTPIVPAPPITATSASTQAK